MQERYNFVDECVCLFYFSPVTDSFHYKGRGEEAQAQKSRPKAAFCFGSPPSRG